MINLDDSSDLGWHVVQEYEAHPLAEDSDDEKKFIGLSFTPTVSSDKRGRLKHAALAPTLRHSLVSLRHKDRGVFNKEEGNRCYVLNLKTLVIGSRTVESGLTRDKMKQLVLVR